MLVIDLLVPRRHKRATICLVQKSCRSHCGWVWRPKLGGEDWVSGTCIVLCLESTRVFNDVGVSTRTIRSILKSYCGLCGHILLNMPGWANLLLPHHVSFRLLGKSTVVENDVRVATWPIPRVVSICGVVCAHHACFDWWMRISARNCSARDGLINV